MNKTFSYIASAAIAVMLIIFFILGFDLWVKYYPKPILCYMYCVFYAIIIVFFCVMTKTDRRFSTAAIFGILGAVLGIILSTLEISIYNQIFPPGNNELRNNKTVALCRMIYVASKLLLLTALVIWYIFLKEFKEVKALKYMIIISIIIMLFSIIEDRLPIQPHDMTWETFRSIQLEKHETIIYTRKCLYFAVWGAIIFLFGRYKAPGKGNVAKLASTPAIQEEPVVITPVPADTADTERTRIYVPKKTPQPTHLTQGVLLQGGKYRIEGILGQGGFGITYMAVQTVLNRKVAIKEFFMKEYCERDRRKNHVTMGTSGSKEMVNRFKAKFIKEAQTIAGMENHHIVKIFDIFEENGTAYYVMEYLNGGNLVNGLPEGTALDETTAVNHIRQICDALQYIHAHNILHLDIKPNNIMFRNSGEAVLIDFGISKHYDDEGGSQTSSTPVGISRGYAPLEQYNKVGVAAFTPSTDIYSVGATLYRLVTGKTPADANEVHEDGLGEFPAEVSEKVRNAICKAMEPRRKDRPQSIADFLDLLT